MLRQAYSAGKRERTLAKRNAGEHLSDLDRDLLVEIARLLCDARTLCRLAQVCQHWCTTAADASDMLWQPLLASRYPRALAALKLLPMADVSYKALYRDQLACAVAQPRVRPKPTCQLSDFIFTVELIKEVNACVAPQPAVTAMEYWKAAKRLELNDDDTEPTYMEWHTQ